MKIYLSPAGKTALNVEGFLDRAKEEFEFDLVILLTDSTYTTRLYEKFRNENVYIVSLAHPLYGLADYIPSVKRLVRQTLMFCPHPDLIVVNSSGGTEKMTNIVKDAADILSIDHKILRVFGVYDVVYGDVVFTMKPEIDRRDILEEVEAELERLRKIKEELDADTCLDINEEPG